MGKDEVILRLLIVYYQENENQEKCTKLSKKRNSRSYDDKM